MLVQTKPRERLSMTTQSKTMMVVQGLAFAVYWPITIDLVNSANHPPVPVLVISAAVSVLLGVLAVAANLYRDRCYQDPVLRSLYNSFQASATIMALTTITLSVGICKELRIPPAERGASFYEIDLMLALVSIPVLMLGWRLFRWWTSHRRAGGV
jgi:uncharacterized membrane protein